MNHIDELRVEIEEKKKKLKELEEEERFLEKSGPEYTLAIALHEKFCHWNHTDGCGWFYGVKDGIHDWNEFSHQSYLEKARKLLGGTGLDKETIMLVIENL